MLLRPIIWLLTLASLLVNFVVLHSRWGSDPTQDPLIPPIPPTVEYQIVSRNATRDHGVDRAANDVQTYQESTIQLVPVPIALGKFFLPSDDGLLTHDGQLSKQFAQSFQLSERETARLTHSLIVARDHICDYECKQSIIAVDVDESVVIEVPSVRGEVERVLSRLESEIQDIVRDTRTESLMYFAQNDPFLRDATGDIKLQIFREEQKPWIRIWHEGTVIKSEELTPESSSYYRYRHLLVTHLDRFPRSDEEAE